MHVCILIREDLTQIISSWNAACYPVGTQRCFNVEEWLKSSCNVDQPLFNVDSTLMFQRWNPNHISTLIPRWRPNLFSTLKKITTFLRWNNVLINETQHIFSNFKLPFYFIFYLAFTYILAIVKALHNVFYKY